MPAESINAVSLWRFGPFVITDALVTTWAIMLVVIVSAFVLRPRLRTAKPSRWQVVVEAGMGACEATVRSVAPLHYRAITPFIATLWGFLAVANLVGLIPGLHSPTRELSLPVALAIVVFISVHWYGIRLQGLRTYLRHYLLPTPFLLPFHVIGEISRTIALAVRLFGNIMSMEMIGMLMLLVAGLLVPVPLLLLHIIEALVQAYIFGMLALVYIASGLQSQQISGDSSL